jgi:uncharacterized membrane protein YeaQ/YmgE (transglycosylase-associated protein family)
MVDTPQGLGADQDAHSRDYRHRALVAGIIAKLVTPGDRNEPQGFIMTTILGIIGAFVATYLGQAIGWYGPDQNAGFIGAIVGAVLVLLAWGLIQKGRGAVS